MAARDLILIGGLGLAAWLLWRSQQTGELAGFVLTGPAGDGAAPGSDYLAKLAHAESRGNPAAKAATSSASGLFQFLKSTWESLGGQWGPHVGLPFGGLPVSASDQIAAAERLTSINAAILTAAGIPTTDPNLYAAHFLGPSDAVKVLTAPMATPIPALVSQAVLSANPFLRTMTVATFTAWLQRKMG